MRRALDGWVARKSGCPPSPAMLLHAPPERDRGRRLVAGLRHVVEAERIRLQLLRARERPHDAELGGAGAERHQQIGRDLNVAEGEQARRETQAERDEVLA